jgi:hypothetical protein
MLTKTQILNTERVTNNYLQRIHQTFNDWKRTKSNAAYQEWSDTCISFHQTEHPTDTLWSNEHREKLKSGDREAIEDTILYLEVDPWYFRSGYVKEWLLDTLRKAPLSEDDKSRLRNVILAVTAGKNRREFRRYCFLAKKIINEEFKRIVAEKAGTLIPGNCKKFETLNKTLVEDWPG